MLAFVLRRVSAVVALVLLLSAPGRTQSCPTGCWAGPYQYACQVFPNGTTQGNPPDPTTCFSVEFSSAALIPYGPYRGWVLLWLKETDSACALTNTTVTYLFDPARPETLAKIQGRLQGNIFCAGHSWDPTGDLIVVGGDFYGGMLGPVFTYRFEPGLLGFPAVYPPGVCPVGDISGQPWTNLGDMSIARYYATLITLAREAIPGTALAGGSSFVLGGAPNGVGDDGNEYWQALPTGASTWSPTLYPDGGGTHVIPAVPNELYVRKSFQQSVPASLPVPVLDTYPRAFQLTDVGISPNPVYRKNILVAGDIDTRVNEGPEVAATAGASQVIRPRYVGGPTMNWEFWPVADIAGVPNLDRFYGTATIRQDRAPSLFSDGKNRVLVIGGTHDLLPATCAPGCSCPAQATPHDWVLTPTVQEYVAGSNTANGPGGQTGFAKWVTKNNAPTPRLYPNSVVLPDGKILIIGGANAISHCDGSPTSPKFEPEIFDPGAAGDPTCPPPVTMSRPNNVPGSNPARPYARLYHQVSMLLADGRILSIGGSANGVDPDPRFAADIFSPPYLSYGYRPTLSKVFDSTGPIESVGFGTTFMAEVKHTKTIDGFVLLRPGAMTHNFDFDQRYIELNATAIISTPGKSTYQITAPSDQLGPPGYYMLYVLEVENGKRAPSTARFIRLY